jgi:hypothetical protein
MRPLIIGIITATFLIIYNKVFANNELSALNLVIPCIIGGISVAIMMFK